MSTHLWFVHLLNWHFLLHLPPLQRPGICAVHNFQRLRFDSLPTSSQERVKQESTFTFTFTLWTIYAISKGGDLPPTMKKPHSLSHTHTLSNSLCLLQGLQSICGKNGGECGDGTITAGKGTDLSCDTGGRWHARSRQGGWSIFWWGFRAWNFIYLPWEDSLRIKHHRGENLGHRYKSSIT